MLALSAAMLVGTVAPVVYSAVAYWRGWNVEHGAGWGDESRSVSSARVTVYLLRDQGGVLEPSYADVAIFNRRTADAHEEFQEAFHYVGWDGPVDELVRGLSEMYPDDAAFLLRVHRDELKPEDGTYGLVTQERTLARAD